MSDFIHHDGLFSYSTRRGETWGVRLKIQGRHKSWQGFHDRTSAVQFRDKVRKERSEGRFIHEKYALASGRELLTTTIDHYLTTIEHLASAREEQTYAAFWKQRFPRSTVNSLTLNALERARSALRNLGGPNAQSTATVNRYVAWLSHVVNHAIARAIATTNPVSKLTPYSEPPVHTT